MADNDLTAEEREAREAFRTLLREHEALPALPRWCACGHRAETIYQRETHLAEASLPVVAARVAAAEQAWAEERTRLIEAHQKAARFADQNYARAEAAEQERDELLERYEELSMAARLNRERAEAAEQERDNGRRVATHYQRQIKALQSDEHRSEVWQRAEAVERERDEALARIAAVKGVLNRGYHYHTAGRLADETLAALAATPEDDDA